VGVEGASNLRGEVSRVLVVLIVQLKRKKSNKFISSTVKSCSLYKNRLSFFEAYKSSSIARQSSFETRQISFETLQSSSET
jgi:hypothetical protein